MSLLKFSSLINKPMLDDVCAPNELTPHELKVLVCLSGEGTLTGHEISKLMSMPPMNVSRALSALHKLGWLEPAENDDNRRRRPYRISPKGWREFRAMLPGFRSISSRLFQSIGKTDRKELLRLINLANTQLENWP